MINNKWDDVLSIPEGVSGSHKIEHFYSEGPVNAHNGRTILLGQKSLTLPFEGKKRWHRLSYDGGVWMTDLPIEQRQHDEQMKRFVGYDHILVGGLGLGYALRKLVVDYDVEYITVVEISKDVINLVWPHVHPEVKERCELVHADLFDHLKTTPDCYDAAFFDIWQGDGETTFHETVVPLRQLARRNIGDDVVCWNEDQMRSQLYMSLIGSHALLSAHEKDPKRIEMLKEELLRTDTPYRKWAVPFWQHVFQSTDTRDFMSDAGSYVRLYEQVEDWLEIWQSRIVTK